MIEVVNILGRSQQGCTSPYICRCDNDLEYFVKGLDAARSSQIYEWVSANLGRKMGLPIPDFKIVNVDEVFLSVPDFRGIGTGPAFASQKVSVNELILANVRDVPEALQRDVFMFDYWINNGDRNLTEKGGNPNLFWNPAEDKLVVIDHNLAFAGEFSKSDFIECHAFREEGLKVFGDMCHRSHYISLFEDMLSDFELIFNEIPEEWLYLDSDMSIASTYLKADAIFAILSRCSTDDFWMLP